MPRSPPPDDEHDTDYDDRRMSSSAASDSSLHSRPDKRAFDFSPSASPVPKRARPDAADPAAGVLAYPPDDAAPRGSASPRVQLPSIASAFHDRHDLRRASLPSALDLGAHRLRLPTPGGHRALAPSPAGLAAYQFPAPAPDSADDRRPRLATDLLYSDYAGSVPPTAVSPASSFSLPGASPADDGAWAAPARPASTPGAAKYDDLRADALYAGVGRIAGQHERPRGVKAEDGGWPAPFDFASSAGGGMASGLPAASPPPPARSPPAQPLPSLVERPPRKRGKLPKPVTDFLKDWLHRHSDHPYPSEEEKKQLCNATGLSMSQVSNWMINVRPSHCALHAMHG